MKRSSILLLLILQVGLSISAQIKLPAQNIRKNYFVINIPNQDLMANLESSGVLFNKEKAIGQYSILLKTSNMVLCQLDYGNVSLLDPSSYILVKSTPKQLAQKPKVEESIVPKPSPSITTTPQESLPPPVSDGFEASGFAFKKLGNLYISTNLFSFSRFGTIENLNAFLDQLNSSKSGYTFNIPSDTFIRSHLEYFKNSLSKKFLLCLMDKNLSYAYFPEFGDVVFKTISSFTVVEMPEKFFFYTVATK